MSQPPELHVHGAVASITLRRPEQANRLEPDDLGVICDHVAAVNSNPAVGVLCFRSTGTYFCSGYDIGRIGAAVMHFDIQLVTGPQSGGRRTHIERCRAAAGRSAHNLHFDVHQLLFAGLRLRRLHQPEQVLCAGNAAQMLVEPGAQLLVERRRPKTRRRTRVTGIEAAARLEV